MDNLPDKLTEEEFLELGELYEKYDDACDLVRYYKMMNAAVEIVAPLVEKMEQTKKELNYFSTD